MKIPQENPTSTELLAKAQNALTPEQYERIKKRALDKMNVIEMASMGLEELKKQLPGIVSGDPEEHDIMTRLDSVFPGVRNTPAIPASGDTKKDSPVRFTEHPWKYVKQTTNQAVEWMYESLVPDRFKEVRETKNKGSSAKVVAATVLGGATAGEAVASVERAMSWWNRLQKDPMAWFKELFDAFLSFDFKKISAFFSGTLDDMGLSSDIVTKFAEKWLPSSLLKTAKSIFSIQSFTDMEFGKVEKIWKLYQKSNNIDELIKLGIPKDKLEGVIPILENLFAKDSKDNFSELLGTDIDLSKLKLSELLRNLGT